MTGVPSAQNPSMHLLPHEHQVNSASRLFQAAASPRSPSRIPSVNTRLQEDTGHCSPPQSQCSIKHRFNTGIHTWPQIQFGITVPFQMGAVCFLQPLGDRQEDLVGYMEGPGIEQNNAVLGQTEPHDHPASQPAPSAHSPSSRAIATLTEPATHLVDSRSRQTGWNYQGSPYKLYCTLEASRLGNSDCSTVYCLVKMTHTQLSVLTAGV